MFGELMFSVVLIYGQLLQLLNFAMRCENWLYEASQDFV